jgi:hypothetical protein
VELLTISSGPSVSGFFRFVSWQLQEFSLGTNPFFYGSRIWTVVWIVRDHVFDHEFLGRKSGKLSVRNEVY